MTQSSGTGRKLAMAMLALALHGCAAAELNRQTEADENANNLPPANARAEILALMRTYLNDPTNVREAFVTEPAIRDMQGRRYASCLRYNARSTDGRYAGVKDSVITFRLGRLDRIIENGRDLCRDAAYQPFPELERLSR